MREREGEIPVDAEYNYMKSLIPVNECTRVSTSRWQYVDAAADATHDSYISLESKRKVLAKTVRCKTMNQSEREEKTTL